MKMKKLLAAALAATMMISSMVTSMVASAETTNTVVTINPIKIGATEYTADIDINFDAAVTAPHLMLEIDADGAIKTITSDATESIDVNTENGKILVETNVKEATDVTALNLDATFTLTDPAVADQTITVTVTITEAVDYNEKDIAVTGGTGTYTLEVPHECAAGTAVPNNDGTHDIPCTGCDKLVADNEACNYVDGVCSVCGYADPNYVPEEHEHSWGEWIIDTEATNTSNGAKHRECKCGETEEAIIPAIMKFASASLTLESSITVNYKVKPEYFTNYGYTDHYVVFTCNGSSTRVDEYTIEGSGSSQRYVFEFNGVSSYMMSYEIVAVLYATYNGELYASPEQSYSVKQYCYNQLGKSTDSEFKTMLVDLLNYGTAAQQKWGHSLDNLANAELTEEQASWGTSESRTFTDSLNTTYATIDNATATWKAAALLLEDAVVMRMRFVSDDITGLTVKVTSDRGKEWIIPNESITWNASAARYEVLFDSLMAYEMSDVVYFTILKDGVVTSNTISYSIESYAARNSDASYDAVLDAMMKYGDSAKVYFKK